MGFCQPRIPNEAWPVRFDLSDTYTELAQLSGLCLVYLCLWPHNSLFQEGESVRKSDLDLPAGLLIMRPLVKMDQEHPLLV